MPSAKPAASAQVVPPQEELVVLVVRAAKALVERMKAEIPGADTSPMTAVHGFAARYLLGRDEVTAGELARHLQITKQATSEVVAQLEQAGIVHRAPHPRDGRARVVRLTAEGAERLDVGRRRWQELEGEWVALVGQDTVNVMRDGLTAYLDSR